MSKIFDQLERLEDASPQPTTPRPAASAVTSILPPTPSKLMAVPQPTIKRDEPLFSPRLAEFPRQPLAAPVEASKGKALSPKGNTLQGFAFDVSMVLIALGVFAGICVALGSADVIVLTHNAPWLAVVPVSLTGLYWLLPKILRRGTPGAALTRDSAEVSEYAPSVRNNRRGLETLGRLSVPVERPRPVSVLRRPLLEELSLAGRILGAQGVLDVQGSLSVRDDSNPNRIYMAGSEIAEYDLNGKPATDDPSQAHQDRFLHCEIYRARPDVMAIVHSQAPELIPFAASSVPLLPVLEMADFLVTGVPVFESRRVGEVTDAAMRARAIGQAIAETLGDKAAVLMRGRGAVIVGPSLPVAVGRAYFTNLNARLQAQSILLGGTVNYLE